MGIPTDVRAVAIIYACIATLNWFLLCEPLASRILIEESAIDRIYSDGGTICANRAWRIGRSNNSKVFYKDIRNEKGKYVIDILLDMLSFNLLILLLCSLILFLYLYKLFSFCLVTYFN